MRRLHDPLCAASKPSWVPGGRPSTAAAECAAGRPQPLGSRRDWASRQGPTLRSHSPLDKPLVCPRGQDPSCCAPRAGVMWPLNVERAALFVVVYLLHLPESIDGTTALSATR